MANPEHLAKLIEAVEAGDIELWNAWRAEMLLPPNPLPQTYGDWQEWKSRHPLRVPDLRGVSFSGAGLEKANLTGAELEGADLQGASLDGANLSGANLVGANLQRANLIGANLHSAFIGRARFDDADLNNADLAHSYLFETSFVQANLNEANLESAYIAMAQMTGAYLGRAALGNANLTGAALTDANLTSAKLTNTLLGKADLANTKLCEARLCDANLHEAKLQDADLHNADLRGADIRAANFSDADVAGVTYNRRMKCMGARVSSSFGSERFKSFVQDQSYIEELLQTRQGRAAYWIWLTVCDCGRSWYLLLVWTVAIIIGFSFIYEWLGLHGCIKFTTDVQQLELTSWYTYLYFSVTTFSTFGIGDLVPYNHTAAGWVLTEVLLGYAMLGALISVLATKMWRRN
jgi:uncharacterized protein YjbI with pentapeptide repeats